MNINEFILSKLETTVLVCLFYQSIYDDILEPIMSDQTDKRGDPFGIFANGLVSDSDEIPEDMELTYRELLHELRRRGFFNDKGIRK